MSQISSTNPVGNEISRTPKNQFSEMSTEDFIRIIFTELTNQDPLKPSDSGSLLQQVSSIRTIESDMNLTEQLDRLVQENQLASAGNLIGKFVGGLTEENDRVAGYVVSIIKQGDSVNLELDSGWVVPISNVETIIDPSLFEENDDGAASAETPNQPPSQSTSA